MAGEATLLDRLRALERRLDFLERGAAVGITGTDQTIKGSHDRLDAILGAGGSTFNLDADNLEQSGGVLRFSALAAGNGLTGGAGAALAVNVDGSTIEISSDALRIKGLTRKFFIPATRGYVANTSAPLHGADARGFLCDDAIDTYVVGNWYLPVDYASGLTIVAVVSVSGTTGSWYGANVVYCGAANQDWDTHSDTSGYDQVASAEEQKEAQSVSVSNVAAGDYVTCVFHRDGNAANDSATAMAVYCKGWLASYTATR